MEPTIFQNYVDKYFAPLVVSTTNLLNGKEGELEYFHLRYLKPEYSVTGDWASISSYNKYVAADVIALDASIPVKRAPSLETAVGKLPKVATRRQLNETDLRKVQLLEKNTTDRSKQIRQMIFEHVPQVIKGQYEKHEMLFLQALSTGILLADNVTNVGTQIRVDFGYKASNKANASVVWGSAGYTPLSDLENLAEKARAAGSPVKKWLLDRISFNQIRKSQEAKDLFNPAAPIISLNLSQLNDIALENFGFTFEIIDRTVNVEIDGVQTIVTPWQRGQVIGISDETLGSFVYSDVAEMSYPVGGVSYQSAGVGGYMLVKKYRMNDPALAEVTASESLSLPVLGNVNRIYKLDTTAIA